MAKPRIAVALLPGALGRAATLDAARAFFEKKRTTLAVSYSTKNVGPIVFARDLVRLLDRARIDRVHVVGFSLGATMARTFAQIEPRRCASLVLVGAGAPDPERGRRLMRSFRFMRYVPAPFLRKRWREEIRDLLPDGAGTDGAVAAARNRALTLIERMPGSELIGNRARLAALDVSEFSLAPTPAAIPVLQIDLAKDEVIPPEERALLRQLEPSAVVETLPVLGHGATLTLPASLLERVETWMDRWPASGAS